jgi:hypothetical protein
MISSRKQEKQMKHIASKGAHMKTMTRSTIYVAMAAMILAAALATPAAAQQQVPFKGTFQGKDAVHPPTITTSGTGLGTHMGEFSLTEVVNVITLNGSAHWVAANGDSIDTTFIASPDFSTEPLGYVAVTETHTITGGTGRFAGAQGSFILERTHLVAPSADGTHVTFGSFHGSITAPGTGR